MTAHESLVVTSDFAVQRMRLLFYSNTSNLLYRYIVAYQRHYSYSKHETIRMEAGHGY